MSAASGAARNVDQVGDVLGVPGVEAALVLLGHLAEEVLGHAGAGPRGDGVDVTP
jgi:hypothetical protein